MRVRSVAASDIVIAIYLPPDPHIRVFQETVHTPYERVCQAFEAILHAVEFLWAIYIAVLPIWKWAIKAPTVCPPDFWNIDMTTYQPTHKPTAALILANGEVFYGDGIGHIGSAVGEVCFNTAMTGYQEILTDPSYAAQIVCFTFPHVGNTGTTVEDEEASSARAERAAVGGIFRAAVTPASNWRSDAELGDWLAARKIVGLSGVDTRALTAFILSATMVCLMA